MSTIFALFYRLYDKKNDMPSEKFVWNEEREKSFEELKQRLVSAPVLTLPSGSGGFQIYSDASKKGLGCDTRLVVPNDVSLKEALLTEAHSSPFSVHPARNRTITRYPFSYCIRQRPTFRVSFLERLTESLGNQAQVQYCFSSPDRRSERAYYSDTFMRIRMDGQLG
nr:putative reverse transcriptase domain, aspartic peptidase domain protein [Tanacetum cinerariifolium]